jgi:hypothetical protein
MDILYKKSQFFSISYEILDSISFSIKILTFTIIILHKFNNNSYAYLHILVLDKSY